MAISKKNININFGNSTAMESLRQILDTALVSTLGIAESVNTNIANGLDIVGDGLTFSMSKGTSAVVQTLTAVLADDSSRVNIAKGSSANTMATYLYLTSSSALLLLGNSTTYQTPIIFTKTNNGKLAVITIVGNQQISDIENFPNGGHHAFSGDDYTLQSVARGIVTDRTLVSANQVQLAPFITNPGVGVSSYTPTAFYATVSNVICKNYGDWQTYILGDHKYLTNGGWWLKDDPV